MSEQEELELINQVLINNTNSTLQILNQLLIPLLENSND